MKSNGTIICIILMLLAGGGEGLAEERLGEINWSDPELSAMRSSGPPPFGPGSGGLESTGAGELADARLPVRGLLTSDLTAVFSARQPGLEAADPISADEIDIPPDLQPDVMIADDNTHYNILYELEEGAVQVLCEGTRRFAEAPISNVVLGVATEDGEHDEIFEAQAQESKYGEVLYVCRISCATFEVRSYCEDSTYAQEALNRQTLLFPGVKD